MSPFMKTAFVSLVCLFFAVCFAARIKAKKGRNKAATNSSHRLESPRPVMRLSEPIRASVIDIEADNIHISKVTCGWRPEYDGDGRLRMPYDDEVASPDEWREFRMHILEYVGHGVEGNVWLAEEASGEQGLIVALKVFKNGKSSYEDSRRTCERHNTLADSKIHGKYPTVPRCFTFCKVIQPGGKEETSAIGMEYIQGGLTAEPFFAFEMNDTTESQDNYSARIATWPTAAANLVSNVAAMTQLGFGIPDMLQDNVRITADGEAYLVDLGLVTPYPRLEVPATPEQLQSVKGECDMLFGMFMGGTLAYMLDAANSGVGGGYLMKAIETQLLKWRSAKSFTIHLNEESAFDLFGSESGKELWPRGLPEVDSWRSAVRSVLSSW